MPHDLEQQPRKPQWKPEPTPSEGQNSYEGNPCEHIILDHHETLL